MPSPWDLLTQGLKLPLLRLLQWQVDSPPEAPIRKPNQTDLIEDIPDNDQYFPKLSGHQK